MVKVINTLIEKKENCGHNVLVECAKALNVILPVFSKQVKTADLYLLNAKFKKTFGDIYSLAVKYREAQDLTAYTKIKELPLENKVLFPCFSIVIDIQCVQ